mmetsp:Transcript_25880/g.38456  ORF Transcript_25880/g.38456 Transcript_25880/m.38456 type:complete len:543 (-) Transcript_25880:4-1632(-)
MTSSTLASLLLILIALATTSTTTHAAATATQDSTQSSSSSTTTQTSSSRRERNLDHWDAETLAAYLGMDPITGKPLPTASTGKEGEVLDQYVGHDAAVMFYAQWCPNCHKLAPTWDAIAGLLKAGSKKSNLIMALFDCEKDTTHMKLCSNAGVRHYPTLLFAGSGPIQDTDPVTSAIFGEDKSAGPAGKAKLARTVKFQGEMGYGESIMDWIRAMQGLSTWHKLTESGPLRFVRDGFLSFLFKKNKGRLGDSASDSLPVGVPPAFRAKSVPTSASTGTASGAAGSAQRSTADTLKINALEAKVQKTEEESEQMKKLATHASLLLDSVLFPVKPTTDEITAATVAGKEKPTFRDVYSELKKTNGWDAKAKLLTDKEKESTSSTDRVAGKSIETINSEILRTCALELSLDYCTRVSTHATNDFLDELSKISDDDISEYPSMLELEQKLVAMIKEDEPFCAVFDDCLNKDFDDESCRPDVCPFKEAGCRYISSCFLDSIQDEYAIAIGYINEGKTLSSLVDAMEMGAAYAAAGAAGGGWGVGGAA